MDVSEFGPGDNLEIDIPDASDLQIVFSGSNIDDSGVAVNTSNELEIVGLGIGRSSSSGVAVGSSDITGVCAIIVDGKLYARIALHSSSFSVDDCFALPLPLFAYREEEAVQPISIENNVAGWEIYSTYQPTRIVGFNLPTSLKYTADSVEHDFTAVGGDYGIEFTTPDGATRIAIFDKVFWLYMR